IIHLKSRQQTTDHQQGGSERWSENPAPTPLLPSQINTDVVDVNNESPNTIAAPPQKQPIFKDNIFALATTIYAAILSFLSGLLTKWKKLKTKVHTFNIWYIIYSVCLFVSLSILACLCYAELDDDIVRFETTDFGDRPLTEPKVTENIIDFTLPMVISTVVACLVGSFVISTQKLNFIKISKPKSFSRIIIASTCFLLISLATFCWYMEIIENPLSFNWLVDSFSPHESPSESSSYFELEWISDYFQKEEATYKTSGWSLFSSLFEQPPPKTYLAVIIEYFTKDPPQASLW
uniref:Uncharacterized protein n=2 Tax=Clytia hemisphaerica TaxID=252671 RepID=A0A7M5UQH8_9CNID